MRRAGAATRAHTFPLSCLPGGGVGPLRAGAPLGLRNTYAGLTHGLRTLGIATCARWRARLHAGPWIPKHLFSLSFRTQTPMLDPSSLLEGEALALVCLRPGRPGPSRAHGMCVHMRAWLHVLVCVCRLRNCASRTRSHACESRAVRWRACNTCFGLRHHLRMGYACLRQVTQNQTSHKRRLTYQ